MISFIQPLPVGNAMQIVIAPPEGAVRSRVLRRADDQFAGHDDPGALVVLDGTEKGVVDATTMANGEPYYYHVYYLIGGAWKDLYPTVFATPASTQRMVGPDPLDLVRDRLDWGFASLVSAGVLTHPRNQIPVMTAPPQFDSSILPLVIVHVASDTSAERAIGETVLPDYYNTDLDLWDTHDGWLSSVSLHIEIWSLNSDERLLLRKALKGIIQGNLPVFDGAGMVHIDLQLSDLDDFTSMNVPVYQVMGTFSCMAPAFVVRSDDPIRDIEVFGSTIGN